MQVHRKLRCKKLTQPQYYIFIINIIVKFYLKSFVHISTAYANCDRLHISEEVYNPPVQPNLLIEAIDWIEDDLLNELTPQVIQLRPNTYTYTKAIAETLIMQGILSFNIHIEKAFP